MKIEQKPLTKESIENILSFLPYFSEDNEFGKLPPEEVRNSITTHFPIHEYSDKVNEFERTLYDADFIMGFDWVAWDEGRKIISDKNLIKQADLLTLRKLISAVLKAGC